MTRQLNVQQQNALTTDGILKAAALFQTSDRRIVWLVPALRGRGEANASGLLVAFGTVPDQSGGHWVQGTWLTRARRFWEFAVVVPRGDNEQVEIERLEDITESVLVSAHDPGTGKSFGFLALEVLKQRLGCECGSD